MNSTLRGRPRPKVLLRALLAGAPLLLAACAHRATAPSHAAAGSAAPASVAPASAALVEPDTVPITPERAPVCYACFWRYQPTGFRDEVLRVYQHRAIADPLARAESRLIQARIAADSAALCRLSATFDSLAVSEAEAARRLLAAETVAFLAGGCGATPGPLFQRAAAVAREAGEPVKARIYDDVAAGSFRPLRGPTPINAPAAAPAGTSAYILGESAIRVAPGTKVVAQVERVSRDWLSYQLGYDFRGTPLDTGRILDYHEGSRLRAILAGTPADVRSASGTLLVNAGGRWLAPDENGIFRYEVQRDKVEYPTTRSWNGLALLVDTHGVSALVESSVRLGAQLVVACGDTDAKMAAAYHLARQGIDVYFPTDRFVADVLGHDAPGTLIGSAPVRRVDGGEVIGDRPIRFGVDELVVAEDIDRSGTLQYYDAPARYFGRLATLLPIRVDTVRVLESGESARVIRRATELGARIVAVRVWNQDDYRPVRDWLAASPTHRAVLFHTAAYPDGYRLFDEFPGQTTFGDPRPRWLGGVAAQ